MLPDHHHQRQEQLARILFATKEAVKGIPQYVCLFFRRDSDHLFHMVNSRLDYTLKSAVEPGLPRIYTTSTDFEGQSIALTFKSRLPVGTRDPKRNLLFLASNASNTTSSQQFVVKFIADGRYGIAAHRKLAETRYAPTLFGVAKVEGAHTAYIMEYLSPGDGWETLHEYAKAHNDVVSRIQTPLDDLLETMRTNGIVHGDLRPNNIMIRHPEGKEEPEIKVIDFDWAGFDGAVRYPLRRNEDLPWPGKAGELIMAGHDRILLMASLPPGT
jgi:serine/threonine protein kinase